jgi:alkylation response protein AidB-like acyl-CoA dehydrogenase
MGMDTAVPDELVAALRDFLADRRPAASASAPVDAVLSREWWRTLGALGLFAIPLPEERGGIGLGLPESALAFEQLGEALSPGPLVWTQLAALLDGAAAQGLTVVAGASMHDRAPGDPLLIPHLDAADQVLLLEDSGATRYERDEIDYVLAPKSIDPATPVYRVNALRGGERCADSQQAAQLRRTGAVLTAALQLGVSQGALQIAVDYARQREQFGRPIGSFQALKHLMADGYVRTSLARASVAAAATSGDASEIASATVLAARAADRNSRMAVQVFGGMGFTWETPPHRYLKRSWLLEFEFGTAERAALTVADGLLADERADTLADNIAGNPAHKVAG